MTDIPDILQAPHFDLNGDGQIEFWEVRQHLGEILLEKDLDGDKTVKGDESTALRAGAFPTVAGALSYQINEDGKPLADLTLARNFWKKGGGAFEFDDRKSTASPGDKPYGSLSYAEWFKDYGKSGASSPVRNA